MEKKNEEQIGTKIEMDKETYIEVCKEIDTWPNWKRAAYEDYFSANAYSEREATVIC
ncbi:MAG: hypothetical protein IJJ13_01930 [Lachnospiraceae bacterium]|nr:hypothetical protein [Lachnospiraceae bacterium]